MLLRPLLQVLCTVILVGAAQAQTDTLAGYYARGITAAELRGHLEVLASDSFMGRDTGKPGQKMAAAYLKKHFATLGIAPIPAPYSDKVVEGYFQQYELIEERAGGLTIQHQGKVLGLLSGLVYFNEVLNGVRSVQEVIWLGDGKVLPPGMDLTNKVVLLDGTRMGKGAAVLGPLRATLEPVRRAGAAVIILSVPEFGGLVDQVHADGSRLSLAYEANSTAPKQGGQLIIVEEPTAKAMVGVRSLRKLRRKKIGRELATNFVISAQANGSTINAENVLAYIEGTDKKDEVVVLTAHYDHIGVENGVVYNGADDDGSGTVALLEIAEAFAQARAEGNGPRRSVLIMPVSGEEKGLLGSKYYSDHPVFPLENTVADLNIDMIGRTDSAHATSAPYVYVIGSDRLSSGLHAANELANGSVGLELDYTFNAESDPNRFYYRSDHYNFARKGVPSIFYFSGVHEDYHQPGDDVEKIRFDLLRQRAELVFRTAWILANQETRIAVDKNAK